MKVELFSNKYQVRKLTNQDVNELYELCSKNVIYYDYCPPFVTQEMLVEDMNILPPGKTKEDKYYIGFYEKERLIAVMDFINDYPQKEMAYIGFFMTDLALQKKGLGTEIIDDLCNYLGELGYKGVRLAWVKGNPQAEHFWLKSQFTPIAETKSNVADQVVLAERLLN